MKQITINMDDLDFISAKIVLDEIGLDMQAAIKIFFTRLIREKGISFVLPKKVENVQKDLNSINENKLTDEYEKRTITKSRAINLFRKDGVKISKNITFASKNRGAYHYWANPEFDLLKSRWFIILNDWINRKLYLFDVPANAIDCDDLTPRNDKKNKIDLQIGYDDDSFRDIRSGVCFSKYLIKQKEY